MLPSSSDITGSARVYHDLAGVEQLKLLASGDREAGIGEVARQFESMLIQMMLSSMRQAGESLTEGGLFDSHQHRVYRDMMDQQLSLDLAQGRGIGLAEIIARQLRGDRQQDPAGDPPAAAIDDRPRLPVRWTQREDAHSVPAGTVGEPLQPARPVELFEGPEDFLRQLQPLAREAAAALGVSPEVLLSQAALETGWGRHQLRHPDGSPSNNLFNIKADARWSGPTVSVRTLEYRDGIAVREQASFRAYANPEVSFRDYVDFIRNGSRYRAALENAGDDRGYILELAAAGYATDPAYADKILELLDGHLLHQVRDHGMTP